MALLSKTQTLIRYHVKGETKDLFLEKIREKLQKNRFPEIEDPASLFSSGWTPFESHYLSDFSDKTISYASFIAFCLRVDKKSLPLKLIQKHFAIESQNYLREQGKEFLSKSEKKALKEDIKSSLLLKIPASPSIYDILWDMERKELYFFSGQKSLNEELETLFAKSFDLQLIRIFPYTAAILSKELSDKEKDLFIRLAPTNFRE